MKQLDESGTNRYEQNSRIDDCRETVGWWGVVSKWLRRASLTAVVFYVAGSVSMANDPESQSTDTIDFRTQIAPIFAEHCVTCHNDSDPQGGLALISAERFRQGGDSGLLLDGETWQQSRLLELVSGAAPEMPKDAAPLKADQIAMISRWIQQGASWPADVSVSAKQPDDTWWSLQPLPTALRISNRTGTTATDRASQNPIDAFIRETLRQQGLSPNPPADRRTLARRLYVDLWGLLPTPAQLAMFQDDADPLAYERLVDQLLSSPRYGERWARHWLDVVHYGDTHGYDKDKPRPNAWPYRDYVIRSLNEDKPYSQFVREQIAGDVLWPDRAEAIEATGFIAAGPWDFIGHAEVSEEKLDGKVARNLDRDDMVSSTMNTFVSTTVQCARCHDHKFDPVRQEHYYSLQAVFAALDRADKKYDVDPQVAAERRGVEYRISELLGSLTNVNQAIQAAGGENLQKLEASIAELQKSLAGESSALEFGYHSQIETRQDVVKWVQIDLREARELSRFVMIGAHDDFNGIGAGFGFPVRFRLEASNDADFQVGVHTIVDQAAADYGNPGTTPQVFAVPSGLGEFRYVRCTATKLAPRQNDFVFALAELQARDVADENVALNAVVTALDSVEQPPRWLTANLVDGIHLGANDKGGQQAKLDLALATRAQLLKDRVDASLFEQQASLQSQLDEVKKRQSELPPQNVVYAGTVHHGSGAFRGRGHVNGQPREIHVLARGEITQPRQFVGPGTIPVIATDPQWQFDALPDDTEGARRVALANWIVRVDNPLTWRSIVNRIWSYHFGRGIVDSPNDFGRMGQLPTHPELLDWLAIWFRDHGQSIKELHRLIVTSETYRRSSANQTAAASVDQDNRFLWRMSRRPLDAESLRDSVLSVSGVLDLTMYGPGFQDFVVERPEHSPHYEYHLYNPNRPESHRRAVYRFLVRSQQQPFMQTLDCADPSQSVARRDTTVTALQSLALLNNHLIICMSERFAERLRADATDRSEQVQLAFRLAIGRDPTKPELASLTAFAEAHGLENLCRVVFNLNEFMFID